MSLTEGGNDVIMGMRRALEDVLSVINESFANVLRMTYRCMLYCLHTVCTSAASTYHNILRFAAVVCSNNCQCLRLAISLFSRILFIVKRTLLLIEIFSRACFPVNTAVTCRECGSLMTLN